MTDMYILQFIFHNEDCIHETTASNLKDAAKLANSFHDEPIRFIRINMEEGTARDVTEDVAGVMQEQYEIGDMPHPLIADWVEEMEPIWEAQAGEEYRHQQAERGR